MIYFNFLKKWKNIKTKVKQLKDLEYFPYDLLVQEN